MSKPFLIIGATSGIAEATAHMLAKKKKQSLVLVGRNLSRLEQIAGDIKIRFNVEVNCAVIDLENTSQHEQEIKKIWATHNGLSGVLIAHGVLGDQKLAEKSFDEVNKVFCLNTLSYLSLLTSLANLFEQQGCGVIAVITSVAADRGRASNYVYGASKAAVSTFVSGLRVRLASRGVSVVDIKPGPIETAMTAHMKKGLMFSHPKTIAPLIVSAIDKNSAVSYVPRIWCLIMLIIRNLPDFIFKKLKNL